jgi:hypothetical protein
VKNHRDKQKLVAPELRHGEEVAEKKKERIAS